MQSLINAEGISLITLNKSYEETIEIPEGKTITIDLNGFNITGTKIIVNGNLNVKDNKGTGEIIITENQIHVDKGKFVLESGNIESTSYGIVGAHGATVIINGGKITSKQNCLAANNKNGHVFFEIHGGTLTAEKGSTIYLPTPASLKITDGTFNGSIELRMGNVEISGGTFNAITDNIDSYDYYAYNGAIWYPDALFINGGRYNSAVDGYTNELNLTITGGTFNSTNGQGSAIAVYDLGYVKQEININISGKAKLTTNSSTKNAYDVYSLTDMGVTSPEAGYGNSEYTGKVKTTITGGTYSSSVKKYLTDDYIMNLENNYYSVIKQQVVIDEPSEPATDELSLIISNDESTTETLLKTLKESAIDISGINPKIEVEFENKTEETVGAEISGSMKEVIKAKKDATIVKYFDISLIVKNAATGNKLGEITDLTSPITLSINLPAELKNVKDGYTRVYYIIKNHDGESEVLDAKYNTTTNMLDFESNGFSTYALAYVDVLSTSIENPKTFDGITNYILLGIVSLIGFIGTGLYFKKELTKN